jgi:uncharacterized protein YqgC (DUF456 family)
MVDEEQGEEMIFTQLQIFGIIFIPFVGGLLIGEYIEYHNHLNIR